MSIPPAESLKATTQIASALLTFLDSPPPGFIGGYVAMRGEVPLESALTELHTRGWHIGLPVINQKNAPLTYHGWQPGTLLSPGIHNVHIPPTTHPPLQPHILLVPLLAFDRCGARLGYGGGYFDRTIKACRKRDPALRTIGIAYSQQEAEQLPHEAHDQRLDIIITEKETILIEAD